MTVAALRAWFAQADLPGTIRINVGERITNPTLYIAANLARAERPGYAGRCSLQKLENLKTLIEKEK